MIAVCMDDSGILEAAVYTSGTVLSFHGTRIVFTSSAEGWMIRASGGIAFAKEGSYAGGICWKGEAGGNEKFTVTLYENENETGSFRAFGMDRQDIYISSVSGGIRISPEEDRNAAAVCRQDGSVTALNGRIFINGRKAGMRSAVSKTDVIQTAAVKLFLQNDLILVSAPCHVICPLPEGKRTGAGTPYRADPYCFVRSYRHMPEGKLDISLKEYRPVSETESRPLIYTLGPALTVSCASLAAAVINGMRWYREGRGAAELLPAFLVPFFMVAGILLWNPLAGRYEKKRILRKKAEAEKAYLHYLEKTGNEIRAYYESYGRMVSAILPSSCELIRNLSRHQTPFEMREDGNLMLRIGKGPCRLLSLVLPQEECTDPLIAEKIRQMKQSLAENIIVPEVISTAGCGSFRVTGSRTYVLYLFLQIILFNDPHLFRFTLCTDRQTLRENRWLLEIPHIFENEKRNIVFTDVPRPNTDGCTAAFYERKGYFELYVMMNFERPSLEIRESSGMAEVTDYLTGKQYTVTEDTDHCYGMMSVIRGITDAFEPGKTHSIPVFSTFHSYGCIDDVKDSWNRNSVKDHIIAKLGTTEDGSLMTIDLHEKGNGPHGLIAGTTGSGKTEMLITMIFSLALSYSPQELQFIIIDFKGGGLLNTFLKKDMFLPHLRGKMTNLDESVICRLNVFLRAECARREKLLSELSMEAGRGISSINSYRECFRRHKGFPVLADLIILTDEFAELKKEHPEFLQELISIARIGRSLGIHLILSTQKPGGIVTDQIWANSRFKICMKVTDPQDSMEVLHTKEAAQLKSAGDMILLADDISVRGRAFYTGNVIYGDETGADLLDESGTVMRRIRKGRKGCPESSEILQVLHAASGIRSFRSLWPEKLPVLKRRDVYVRPYVIGIIDDIRSGKHYFMRADSCRLSVVIAPSQNERKAFQRTLKTVIGKSIQNKKTEIRMIEEAAEYFADSSAADTLLGQSREETPVWIFSSYTSSVPYRIRSAADQKIALAGTPQEEIFSLFGTHVKAEMPDEYGGLRGTETVCAFMYFTDGAGDETG